ncbi:tetratricopeptide repeat protein [Pseudoalteromonas luteoviolacea]|uniref:tetratricopeptide repeat protein n=1 Tax=Pseudoalteromonas luteoviolacea TaxID=43657 RepID=UPI001B37A2F5|nr:tetratricopeptide repeat protein [Pseudoalteromonas luteoviolacea]MBQ4840065.1 hypothetical protein [Pseudoalteromonas luteoviolacea]
MFRLFIAFSLCFLSQASNANTTSENSGQPNTELNWINEQIILLQRKNIELEMQVKHLAVDESGLSDIKKEVNLLKLKLVEMQGKYEIVKDNQSRELSNYDRRVGDIYQATNIWGAVLTIFGLIITISAILIGLSARNRAISEAKNAAKEYFDTEGKQLVADEQRKFEDIRNNELQALRQQHENLHSELKLQNDQLLVQSTFSKAESYEKDDNPYLAIAEYDGLVEKFKYSESLEIREEVIFALLRKAVIFTKLNKHNEANKVYSLILDMILKDNFIDNDRLLVRVFFNQGVSFSRLGKEREAIKSFDSIIKSFENTTDQVIKEVMSKASLNKGVHYSKLGDFDKEIEVYEELVARFSNNNSTSIKECVARALLNKATTYKEQGWDDAAIIECLDELIHLYEKEDDHKITDYVITAMFRKVEMLSENKNIEESIDVLQRIADRYGNFNMNEIKSKVATATLKKGELELQHVGFEAALTTYNGYLNQNSSVFTTDSAKIMINKAIILAELNKYEESMSELNELLTCFSGNDHEDFDDYRSHTLYLKAKLLFELERNEESLQIIDEAIHYFNESQEIKIQRRLAKLMIVKSKILISQEQGDNAVENLITLINDFKNSKDTDMKNLVSEAYFIAASTLRELERYEEAINLCNIGLSTLRHISDGSDITLYTLFLEKGLSLTELNKVKEAIDNYDKGVNRLREFTETEAQTITAGLLLEKSNLIKSKFPDKPDCAIEPLTKIIELYNSSEDNALKSSLAIAHNSIGYIYILEAKKVDSVKDSKEQTDFLNKSLGHFEEALSRLDNSTLCGYTIGNEAYALCLLGKFDEAENTFNKALRAPIRGGENLYNATLKDIELHKTKLDNEMRLIVERQWAHWKQEQS